MKTTKRRLHPLAIIVFWVRYLGWVSIPLILSFFKDSNYVETLLIAAGFAGALLLLALFRYGWYFYTFDGQMLTIYSGLLFRKTRQIPFKRIQTVQTNQWFFLKPFGATSVKLETSGKSDNDAEGELPVISQQVADQLQQLVNGNYVQTMTVVPVADDSYSINWSDLNRYALTSMGIVPILLGLLWLYGKLSERLSSQLVGDAVQVYAKYGVLILIVIVVVILLIGMLAGYVMIIQRYYHFRLRKQEDRLVTEKGLFQRNQISTTLTRIQAVAFRQTVIRQLLHLVSVQLILASEATKKEDQNNLVMLPVIQQAQTKLAHQFVDWVPNNVSQPPRLSGKGQWSLIRNALLISLIVTAPFVIWLRPLGYLALLIIPIGGLMSWYAAINCGITQLDDERVSVLAGHHFQRDLYIIPKRKVQSLVLRQSILMKRRQLVHLEINVRQGNSNQSISVRYLSQSVAEAIYQWYRA